MREDSLLLVIIAVVDPRNGVDRLVKLLDIEMMIEEGGGIRILEEYQSLFREAGLELVRTRRTTVEDAVILEAQKFGK